MPPLGRWPRGEANIEAAVRAGELEKVPPDRSAAEELLVVANQRLASARLLQSSDPGTALVVAYDAARLALAAVLENQGLRATSHGGHLALGAACMAQLGPNNALRDFDRLRRMRNAGEYRARLAEDDADTAWAIDLAGELVAIPPKLFDQMGPFRP